MKIVKIAIYDPAYESSLIQINQSYFSQETICQPDYSKDVASDWQILLFYPTILLAL